VRANLTSVSRSILPATFTGMVRKSISNVILVQAHFRQFRNLLDTLNLCFRREAIQTIESWTRGTARLAGGSYLASRDVVFCSALLPSYFPPAFTLVRRKAEATYFALNTQRTRVSRSRVRITMTTSETQHKILVVDDDPQITRVLRTVLSGHSYNVRTAADGDEALEVMRLWAPDLVVTDLSMPNMGGLELCRRIRNKSVVPIIVLSVRDEEKVKVEALDFGADDYVTKPFNVNELMARIRTGLRRASSARRQEDVTKIASGDFCIDLPTRMVTVRGRSIRLTPKEFDLLSYLAKNPGRVITHRTLLAQVWGEMSTQQPEYLHVFMNHLRNKLEPNDGSVRYILTEKRVGYRFEPGGQ